MTLIERLAARARDPKTATDEGGGKGRAFTPPTPVPEEQVQAAEAHLGFSLPPLLRRLYLEIGNGGFGPGAGLVTLASLGPQEKTPNGRPWPTGLIRLCDWGSGIGSLADCAETGTPVVRLDPNMPKRDEAERVPAQRRYSRAAQVPQSCWIESPTLEAWLEAWADGRQLFYLGYGAPDEGGEDDGEEDTDED